MKTHTLNILIAGGDEQLSATAAQHIATSIDANITITDNVDQVRVLCEADEFDAIVASQKLIDGTGLSLLADRAITGEIPIILLDHEPDVQRVLTALRLGAADVFHPPVDMPRLVASVTRAAEKHRRRWQERRRAGRLHKLSSRLLSDRRELRQRVDLLCRDFVHAYRRLAEKYVATQATGQPGDRNSTVKP